MNTGQMDFDEGQENPGSRAMGVTAALVVGLGVLTAAYAFFVEPYWVEVTRHDLTGNVASPIKVAHLSNVCLSGLGVRERKMLERMAIETPHMIIITGQAVDTGAPLETARPFFEKLKAPLGVWVAYHHFSVPFDEADRFFRSVGANLLASTGTLARPDLWIAGGDSRRGEEADYAASLAPAPAASFKIVVFNVPDVFPQVAGLFNLGVAGQPPGGQINLPLVGALGDRGPYPEGWFKLNNSHLYVTRSLGAPGFSARLLSRPELALIQILPR